MPLAELSRSMAEAIASQSPTLASLRLSHNALKEVANVVLLPPLQQLDLSANQIRELPTNFGQWAKKLEWLDLSHNQM